MFIQIFISLSLSLFLPLSTHTCSISRVCRFVPRCWLTFRDAFSKAVGFCSAQNPIENDAASRDRNTQCKNRIGLNGAHFFLFFFSGSRCLLCVQRAHFVGLAFEPVCYCLVLLVLRLLMFIWCCVSLFHVLFYLIGTAAIFFLFLCSLFLSFSLSLARSLYFLSFILQYPLLCMQFTRLLLHSYNLFIYYLIPYYFRRIMACLLQRSSNTATARSLPHESGIHCLYINEK